MLRNFANYFLYTVFELYTRKRHLSLFHDDACEDCPSRENFLLRPSKFWSISYSDRRRAD